MARIQGPNGQVADVDDLNRLSVLAVTQQLEQSFNLRGSVFSVEFSVTPAGTNDFFFYLQNTGTNNIVIGDIEISSTVPTKVTYEVVSGTAIFVTGTDANITNRNLGSSQALDVNAQFDTDITGLTSEGVLFFEECSIANTKYSLESASGIIIPQGKAVAFRRIEATGQLDVVVTVGEFL